MPCFLRLAAVLLYAAALLPAGLPPGGTAGDGMPTGAGPPPRRSPELCRDNAPHPGFIEIYENNTLREKIPYTDYSIPFLTTRVHREGKECARLIPVEKVYEFYLDAAGNRVDKESGSKVVMIGRDGDGYMLLQTDDTNKKKP